MPFRLKVFLAFTSILAFNSCFAQIDSKGSGRALQFDGVDDYVDLGNIYDELTFPFTVSAWVKLKPGETGGPVFVSQNNLPIYNGFWFFVTPTSISIEYGDGLGENFPAFRRGKNAQIPNITGRWAHVCAVVRGLSDILLYVNGNLVEGNIGGESSLPMASNYPDDVATIGYFLSNGVKYWYKGEIDNVQMYNKQLSIAEIRNSMTKKLAGNESGLIGYWNFDEVSSTQVADKTANHFNGTLIGGVTRKFSGAPMGDENIYQYNIAAGTEVTLNNFTINNFQSGIPQGVHIYHVTSAPSQTGGLSPVPSDYYGVFLADGTNGKTFKIKNTGAACGFMRRVDNSESLWQAFNISSSVTDRGEFATNFSGPSTELELGPELQICDEQQTILQPSLVPSYNGPFLWSTGETSQTIIARQSGKYAVQILDGCGTKTDTVKVTFTKTPPDFSLGNDEKLCVVSPKILQPFQNSDYSFEWQDGSHGPSFAVNTFGNYWLIVKNACGESRDSLTIEQILEPDFRVDLGPDLYFCDVQNVTIRPSLGSTFTGKLQWSTGESSPSIVINKSGEYTLQAQGICSIKKDTIRVDFISAPPPFSLGEDEKVCTVKPRTLRPIENEGYTFEWQDGSNEPSFTVNTFGVYALTIKNSCGESRDSLVISNLDEMEYQMPNVITPNGDASNQHFVVEPQIDNTHLIVFNRWGRTIYETANYQNNWDGEGVASGTYYYAFMPACGEWKKGIISILR